MKKHYFFKTFFIFIASLCIFTLAGTAAYNFDTSPADTKPQEIIKKEPAVPKPLGILISDNAHSSAIVAFLDFEQTTTPILFFDDKNNLSACVYPINRKITVTEDTVKEFIDKIGGITINNADTPWRYTGTQICDMLYQNETYSENPQLILQIFKSIARSKISKENFLFLWEHSQTDISFIDYFTCSDFLSETLLNAVIYE